MKESQVSRHQAAVEAYDNRKQGRPRQVHRFSDEARAIAASGTEGIDYRYKDHVWMEVMS